MIEVGWFSSKLLFKGKLLRNPDYFARQTTLGAGVGVVLLLALTQIGEPLWLSVPTTGFLTGILMPFLLKDVRMK